LQALDGFFTQCYEPVPAVCICERYILPHLLFI
jgi:hypothetical protein